VGGPRFVYVPGRLSSETRDARKRIAEMSDLFLAHQLGLVDIRIAFERQTTLGRWLTEKDLSSLSLGLVPDAYLEYEVNALTYCAFVEYDRGTETLGRIERKVRAYLDLAHSGRFERTFKRKFFRVLMVTDPTFSQSHTEHLRDQLGDLRGVDASLRVVARDDQCAVLATSFLQGHNAVAAVRSDRRRLCFKEVLLN